jgi:hypothetical protein
MSLSVLEESRGHLADLLEAGQRCAWYLQAGAAKVRWPVTGSELAQRSRDLEFYERLAAINERFGKLQDLLATTMRHLCELSGENTESFLRVASFCHKVGILSSLEDWQTCRSLRNRAAHAYGTDYTETAGHFNAMREQIGFLTDTVIGVSAYVRENLQIQAADESFLRDLVGR